MKPPRYVRLNNSALRYKSNKNLPYDWSDKKINPCYYRDAGNWEVEFRYDENLNKWFSVCKHRDMPWLHDVELIPITKKEWLNDNKGYI